MHIASLEAHTTLNTYNLWKLALRSHFNTDVRTRDRTRNPEHFAHENDALTALPQPEFDAQSAPQLSYNPSVIFNNISS